MTNFEYIKIRAALELNRKYLPQNFDEMLADYKKYNDILIHLIDSLHDAKVRLEPWQRNVEVLTVKYNIHAFTFIEILSGTNIKSKYFKNKDKIFDISSAYILARALLENYLTFYYLHIHPNSDNEKKLRSDIYELAGLTHRQQFPANNLELKKKKAKEKEELDKLIVQVESNLAFSALSKELRKQILQGKNNYRPAKIFTWDKLFDISELDDDIFKTSWKLYSNYAHSEFGSTIQLKEYYKSYQQSLEVRHIILLTQLSIICHYIMDIVSLFKIAEIVFNKESIYDIETIKLLTRIKKKK